MLGVAVAIHTANSFECYANHQHHLQILMCLTACRAVATLPVSPCPSTEPVHTCWPGVGKCSSSTELCSAEGFLMRFEG